MTTAATFNRGIFKSNDYNGSIAYQMGIVSQHFATMKDIPGASGGQQFHHAYSLRHLMSLQAILQQLGELPGATLDWAVGFNTSNSSKSQRCNMEWKADGSMLDMRSIISAPVSRPSVIMTKKNLLDGHSSDQRWIAETCSYHSHPLMQARLGEWLEYTEQQIARIQTWVYNQNLRLLEQPVVQNRTKLVEVQKQVENLKAYISQLADPAYIVTYIESQINQSEAKIETLNNQEEIIKSSLQAAQERVDEFKESGVKV
jgi:hypothetical protein